MSRKRRRASRDEDSDSDLSISSEPALSPAAKRRKKEKYKKQARELTSLRSEGALTNFCNNTHPFCSFCVWDPYDDVPPNKGGIAVASAA